MCMMSNARKEKHFSNLTLEPALHGALGYSGVRGHGSHAPMGPVRRPYVEVARLITCATQSSSKLRGRLARSSSSRPSMPCSIWRLLHLPTVASVPAARRYRCRAFTRRWRAQSEPGARSHRAASVSWRCFAVAPPHRSTIATRPPVFLAAPNDRQRLWDH